MNWLSINIINRWDKERADQQTTQATQWLIGSGKQNKLAIFELINTKIFCDGVTEFTLQQLFKLVSICGGLFIKYSKIIIRNEETTSIKIGELASKDETLHWLRIHQ